MPESPIGWWLEVISSQRNKDNFLEVETWSWLTKQSRDNGEEPYIMHKAYMQVRETHQRIVVGANKGVLWQPDKAQPPVEITDFAEFERSGQAIKYKSETVASKLEWEAQDGRKIAPFVFPTYYAVDEPLDPQWVRETFILPAEGQMLANEYAFLARAEANGWSGDWRHSTFNGQVGAGADDSTSAAGSWSASNQRDWLGDSTGSNSHQSRFQNVTIANGSTINTAVYTLQGYAGDASNTVNVLLGFEASDNPAAIADGADYAVRAAVLVGTTVAWNAVPEVFSNTDFSAPDVATSLKNVVDRAGFASGNAVNLFVLNNLSSVSAQRRAESYEADSSNCGRLAVDYTAGGGGPTVKTLAALGVG